MTVGTGLAVLTRLAATLSAGLRVGTAAATACTTARAAAVVLADWTVEIARIGVVRTEILAVVWCGCGGEHVRQIGIVWIVVLVLVFGLVVR